MINKNYDECFLYNINSEVIEVIEENGLFWHCFDSTNFFVECGGMSSDEGKINGYDVLNLKIINDKVYHLLEVKLEGSCLLQVNPHLRFRKCQIHTAQHLISFLLNNIYGANAISRHVSEDENYIEFDIPDLTKRQLKEIELSCNGLIRDDLTVNVTYPSKADAIAKLGKDKIVNNDVRIVSISNLDYNPCGCIHVPSLKYIQLVKIIGLEHTTRGCRIRYIVGDQLLECVDKRYDILDNASNILALSHLYINVGITNLINQKKEYIQEIDFYKKKYLQGLLADIEENELIAIKEFKDIEKKDLNLLVELYYKNKAKIIMFYTIDKNELNIVIADNSEVLDCKKLASKLCAKLDFKGGGSKYQAQLTSMNYDIDEVKKMVFDEII